MARIGSKNTHPELIVRRELHRMGYRFRIHRRGLPGTPDIVFGSRRKAIFVHGCFWHGHECRLGRTPKTRVEFWKGKQEGNTRRDQGNVAELERRGWRVLIVWQCETRDGSDLAARLRSFLGPTSLKKPIDVESGGV
jgi:DNA mismatch endonuclease (patch repair protein)